MLTRNLGCRLIRTSVQEDINVSSVFRYLATKCHQIMMQQYNVVPVGQPTISKSGAERFILRRENQTTNGLTNCTLDSQAHLVQHSQSQMER